MRPGPTWSARRPTWSGSARRSRSRSRSPGEPWPRPTTDRAKAEEALKLTRDEVEKDIDEARAGVKAARASLTLAELEYGRFSRLTEQGASTKERQQQVTQSRDSAQAQVELAEAKLSKALVSRTQVDIARRSLEAAQTGTEKAARGVDLSQLGYDQIHELELLVKVKELTVEEAARALEAAEHDLEYTRVRAPFPGVVVKRYRQPGRLRPGRRDAPEPVQSRAALRGGEPGGDPAARCRAGQSGPRSRSMPSPSRSGAGSSGSTSRPGRSSR